MSAETYEWLNTMTLIGFTDKRGEAWHYKAELQGDEPNHYTGPIPVADVHRRLFNFTVEPKTLWIPLSTACPFPIIPQFKMCENRQAMVTSDTQEDLGVFKGGYQGHGYGAWLIDNVANLLDDGLSIGSAGLLKNRAQAWVQVEVPESIETPEGVTFRPNLTACTSFDGSLSTTYKRNIGIVVCDNTLSGALGENSETFKVKHTTNSLLRLSDAREALSIVHTMADDFAKEVAELCAWTVTRNEFDRTLNVIVPDPEDGNKRGLTVASDKRARIESLYVHDNRAATWNGTAFGVLQAFNTWQHHYAQVRKGVHRAVRNMENVTSGKFAETDAMVLDTLATVCGRAV